MNAETKSSMRALPGTGHAKLRALGIRGTWRRHRRLRVGRWLFLNIGKQSFSLSLGRRGLRLTLGRRGLVVTAGVPGSGIRYQWFWPWRAVVRRKGTLQ